MFQSTRDSEDLPLRYSAKTPHAEASAADPNDVRSLTEKGQEFPDGGARILLSQSQKRHLGLGMELSIALDLPTGEHEKAKEGAWQFVHRMARGRFFGEMFVQQRQSVATSDLRSEGLNEVNPMMPVVLHRWKTEERKGLENGRSSPDGGTILEACVGS